MSRKLTQKEAEQKNLNIGIRMMSKYINSQTKTKFECPFCFKIFLCRPTQVWLKNTKSCGCIKGLKLRFTQKEAEQKSLDVGIKMVGMYINSHKHTKFKCPKCNNIFNATPHTIWTNHTKSCGRCYNPNLKEKFGSLTIIKVIPNSYGGGGCRVEAKCKCGNVWKGEFKCLKTGNTKSCGHCNDPSIGNKFGKLTVIKVIPSMNGCNIQTVCECGRTWQGYARSLKDGRRQSCGNCKTKVNGQTTSIKSLSLEKLLPYYAQHNVRFKKNSTQCIDWVFTYNGKNNKLYPIALEYDEWFWHGHKQKQDKKRYQSLVRKGWRVIQIRASYNTFTQEQINSALQKIENGRKKVTITLNGWGKGPTIADRYLKQKIA